MFAKPSAAADSHPTLCRAACLPQDIAEEGGGAESVIASYDTMGPGALQLALRALDRNIKKLQKAKPEKHAPIREQVIILARIHAAS